MINCTSPERHVHMQPATLEAELFSTNTMEACYFRFDLSPMEAWMIARTFSVTLLVRL